VVHAVTDRRVGASPCCGSARQLSTGGWVVAWGGTGVISETDAAGRPLLTMTLTDGFSYRAVPLEPGRVSRATVLAGMDAMHPRAAG
jgi:hypothetical protein